MSNNPSDLKLKLRFAPAPLPKNTAVSGVSLGDALTAENIFGSSEDRTAQIQRGVEQTILNDMRTRSHVDVWGDPLSCCRDAVESIVKDSFTECFRPRPPDNWSFGPILFVMWLMGAFFRFFILFPIRVVLLLLGSVVFALGCVVLSFILPIVVSGPASSAALRRRRLSASTIATTGTTATATATATAAHQQNELTEEEIEVEKKKLQSYYYKKWLGFYSMWWTFVLAIVIKTHGTPPVKRPNQIYVANHTSLIDFIALKSIVDLATVGQKHVGLVGFMQDRMVSGIWFERFETKQRTSAADLITNWIENPKNDRLLIFPEGVCVNNEYCVMFKKRVFEIENVEICPIAVKYNKSWSDPYWSSKDESFIGHIFRLMRSWCTVCDVWFQEPEKMRDGETGVEFSSRVKASIARRAGLKNLAFDGYLKYYVASEKLGEKRKKLWAEKLLEQFPEISNAAAAIEQPQPEQQEEQEESSNKEEVDATSPSGYTEETNESKKDQ